jgi:hypothetical protein
MAYSCSAHFSDQNSYIKYFYSSYRLKDIDYARFDKNLDFQKTETMEACLTDPELAKLTDQQAQREADGAEGTDQAVEEKMGGA